MNDKYNLKSSLFSILDQGSPNKSIDLKRIYSFVDDIENIIEEYSVEILNLKSKLKDFKSVSEELMYTKQENANLKNKFDLDIQKLKEDTETVMKKNLEIFEHQDREREKLDFELSHFKKINQEKTRIIEDLENRFNNLKEENQVVVKENNNIKITILNLKKESKFFYNNFSFLLEKRIKNKK